MLSLGGDAVSRDPNEPVNIERGCWLVARADRVQESVMMPSEKTCPSNRHWMIKTLIKIRALNAALFLTVMHLR